MTTHTNPAKSARITTLVARAIVNGSLADEELFFDVNEADLRRWLERDKDVRRFADQSVGGDSEFGVEAAVIAFKVLPALWATYKMTKEILDRAEGLQLKDPVVIALWQERLETAGVPKDLARKIAEAHWKDFLQAMRDEGEKQA